MSERLRKTVAYWGDAAAPDFFFVAVATWWFCDPKPRGLWNSLVEGHVGPNTVFLDTVYLPQGDPADRSLEEQRGRGVEGWIIESKGRVVCLVGPNILDRLPFLNHSFFIQIPEKGADTDTANVDIVLDQMKRVSVATPNEGVLFVLAAGRLSKVVITEAFAAFGKDSFIDVGSALDGYAGKVKQGFIRGGIKHYCTSSARWVAPDGLDRQWMAKGVCKESHVWIWMASAVFFVVWSGVICFACIAADKHTGTSKEAPGMEELARRRQAKAKQA